MTTCLPVTIIECENDEWQLPYLVLLFMPVSSLHNLMAVSVCVSLWAIVAGRHSLDCLQWHSMMKDDRFSLCCCCGGGGDGCGSHHVVVSLPYISQILTKALGNKRGPHSPAWWRHPNNNTLPGTHRPPVAGQRNSRHCTLYTAVDCFEQDSGRAVWNDTDSHPRYILRWRYLCLLSSLPPHTPTRLIKVLAREKSLCLWLVAYIHQLLCTLSNLGSPPPLLSSPQLPLPSLFSVRKGTCRWGPCLNPDDFINCEAPCVSFGALYFWRTDLQRIAWRATQFAFIQPWACSTMPLQGWGFSTSAKTTAGTP